MAIGRCWRRILVTGMSGAGKTTLLEELRRRGHHTVDTDDPGWDDGMGQCAATASSVVPE